MAVNAELLLQTTLAAYDAHAPDVASLGTWTSPRLLPMAPAGDSITLGSGISDSHPALSQGT